ncbi:MAG: uracil-DNA glycosylase [Candidatus Symbiobacter sp.]|nr:uracil-DNA glycosylase [Candidatus Symbiobacter sp.]
MMNPSGSSDSAKNQAIIRAWLSWYEAMGVDCAVDNAAVNRFAAAKTAHKTPEIRRASPRAVPRAAAMPPSHALAESPGPGPGTGLGSGPGTVTAPGSAPGGRDLPLPATRDAVAVATARAAAASDLAQLRDAIAGFDLCPLRATATNTVFGEGLDQSPAVMVIGEGPGADEDRLGKPFVGQSGQMLDRMLAEVGLSRHHNIFISNIVYWRPPGNRPPTELEVAMCLPFMLRMIQLVRPKTLLTVGNTPTRALLGRKDGIAKLRGKWVMDQNYGGATAIPTLASFHPAYLLRSPGQKKFFWQDLVSLRVYLQGVS